MDAEELRRSVLAAYSMAAEQPEARHPFPVGRLFAESIGYPVDLLSQIPSAALEAFAGVSSVALFAEVPPNSVVLDLGCGAGLDSLILSRRLGDAGKVVGLDFSVTMLHRANSAATAARAENILFCQADAESIPLGDGAIDLAIVNGIFNLNPVREDIFRELARCLRPGGQVYGAELILREPLPSDLKMGEANWFA